MGFKQFMSRPLLCDFTFRDEDYRLMPQSGICDAVEFTAVVATGDGMTKWVVRGKTAQSSTIEIWLAENKKDGEY